MNSCKSTPNKFVLLNNISLHILILFIILSSLYVFYISKIESKSLNKELINYINNFDLSNIDKKFITKNIVDFIESEQNYKYEKDFVDNINSKCSPTDSFPCNPDGTDPLGGFLTRGAINSLKPTILSKIAMLNNIDPTTGKKIIPENNKTLFNLLNKLNIDKEILKPEYFEFIITNLSNNKNQLTEEINNKIKEEMCITIFFLILLVLFINIVPIKFFNYCNDSIIGIIGELILVFLLIGIIEVWFFENVASKFIPIKESLIIETFKDKILSLIK